jgi:hypothetical protein
MTSFCGLLEIVSEDWSDMEIDCRTVLLRAIHLRPSCPRYLYTTSPISYMVQPCSRVTVGRRSSGQGRALHRTWPARPICSRRTRKSALDPARPRRLPRRNTKLSKTREQYHNHGFLSRGSPRLPRRCLSRLFPGLHLAVAICLHPAWSSAKRRNLHLQHLGGSSPRLLHPYLLHGPRKNSSRLAREYHDRGCLCTPGSRGLLKTAVL